MSPPDLAPELVGVTHFVVELRRRWRRAYVAGYAQWLEAFGALLGDRRGTGRGRRHGHDRSRTNGRRSRGAVPFHWGDGLLPDLLGLASPIGRFEPTSKS